MGRVAVAVIVSLWVISVSILVNRIVPEPYMDEIFHIPQAQQYCIANFRSWDPMITTPPGLDREMGRVAVAVIVSLWVISVSILVNRIVPEPYMDEIFHIPQAQQYCIANFRSWDPMITTPPGLYYLSLVHVASLFPSMFMVQAASSFSEVCTTAILRSVNGVLAVLCSIIVCCIAYCSACYVSCMLEEELLVQCNAWCLGCCHSADEYSLDAFCCIHWGYKYYSCPSKR
nr:dol-p-glc:glc(2)man(9)glcnac(2)-pp-dol alpha-1,2-glucosyltransferase [Quercus suber]